MKFFLIFTAHSLACEQTPEHITSPCVVATPEYFETQCSTLSFVELQPGLLQATCKTQTQE